MLDHIAHVLLALLTGLAAIVLAALAWIEGALGSVMTAAHIPPDLQTILGVAVALLFLIAALQLFGGFIRVVVIVVLLAIVVHAATHRELGVPHPISAQHAQG
jgi:hypothetical protein